MNDPFILLMDDHLDIGDRPVGGPHPHAGFETVTLILDGAIFDRDQGRGDGGSSPGAAEPGGAPPRQWRTPAHSAPGASGRGRGPAGGLVRRSVRAHREGRLFLRARHQRHQGHGGDLRADRDPAQTREGAARPRHHPGAYGRRRGRRRQRRTVAAGPPSRPDRRGIRNQRGRAAIR